MSYHAIELPKYKGHWCLPGNEIWLYQVKRPNWFHRTMMSILIGWKWHDN